MNRWVGSWVTWLEHEKRRMPSTCRLYQRTLEILETDTSGIGPVETLETSDLRSWLHSKGGSPGTWGNRVSALRSFYGYLVERNVRIDDPSRRLEVPKGKPPAREPVRDLSAKLIELDEADIKANAKGVIPRRVGETRDMAVFLAYSGMRISDACALSLKPPVPDRIVISSGGRRDKTIELPFEARSALDKLDGRFGIGARALQRRFEKVGFHPDQLRHWHRVNVMERRLRDENAKHFGGALGSEGDESSRTISAAGETARTSNGQTASPIAVADGNEQVGASPDLEFWLELAGQLEGISELIRERFAHPRH